ncbi:hypothetical protein C8Q73DRAFT_364265 [Cubamyces lactineus]|nr:hypothetical protein C8Q73DRAFT_364265 [Cubamyces lactineus]
MMPEELGNLQNSVKSVKAEYTDLDGLSWNTPAARELLEQRVRPPLKPYLPSKTTSFAILLTWMKTPSAFCACLTRDAVPLLRPSSLTRARMRIPLFQVTFRPSTVMRATRLETM